MSAPGTWGVLNFGLSGLTAQFLPNQQTVSYQLLATDYFVQFNASAAAVATLNSALPVGTAYRIKNINTHSLTIKSTTGNIDQTLGTTGIGLAQWNSVDVVFDGTNWHLV